jgi:holo-[acyl-carrier protein] synthase
MLARTGATLPRTGCDLQRVEDVADAVRDFGARYLDRVYTAAEQ